MMTMSGLVCQQPVRRCNPIAAMDLFVDGAGPYNDGVAHRLGDGLINAARSSLIYVAIELIISSTFGSSFYAAMDHGLKQLRCHGS